MSRACYKWSSESYLGTIWTKAKKYKPPIYYRIWECWNISVLAIPLHHSWPNLKRQNQRRSAPELCVPVLALQSKSGHWREETTLGMGLVSSMWRMTAQSWMYSFLLRKRKSSVGDSSAWWCPWDVTRDLLWVLRWYLSFPPSLQGWDQKKPVLKGMRTHRPYTIGPT